MKPVLFLTLIIALMILSCKKGTPIPTNANGLSHFKVALNNLAPNVSLKEKINYLYYFVADTNHNLIKASTTYSSTPDFGNISDSLKKGSYYILILGSKDSLRINFPNVNFTAPINRTGTLVYYKKVKLNIDKAVNTTVTLEKIVSEIKVDFHDTILPQTMNITMKNLSYNKYPFQNFDLFSGANRETYFLWSKDYGDADVGKPFPALSFYFFGQGANINSFDIEVTARNVHPYTELSFNNLPVPLDKAVKITGSYYSHLGNQNSSTPQPPYGATFQLQGVQTAPDTITVKF